MPLAKVALLSRRSQAIYCGTSGLGGGWNGCDPDTSEFGCGGGGFVWIPGGTACDGGGCTHTPGSWTELPGCDSSCGSIYVPPTGPGGCWSAGTCGIAYSTTPRDGQKCDGSEFEIGSPVEPADNNAAGAAYYVDNIANVWENGEIAAVVYRVNTPSAPGQEYYFIQETNNGASWNWGVSAGVNFGAVSIGVSGGQTYNMVSPLTWFYPGQTKLKTGDTFESCWPGSPMES